MKITVAICTFNRANLLEKTLERITYAKKPKKLELELLVVNNRCTDSTDDIINLYSQKLPLTRIYQPVQGLSNARNAAVDAATGDYILWTDDDVLVSENWLLAYEEAIIKNQNVAVFGGPVQPWFEEDPPAWISENWELLASAFATRNLGEMEIPLNPYKGLTPFGANYCLRMREQSCFLYDSKLGRNGTKTVLGEETEVIRKIFDTGGSGLWIPNASVQHWIPKNRMQIQYIADYFQGVGRTQVILNETAPCKMIAGIPRWKVSQFIKSWTRFHSQRILFGAKNNISTLCELETLRGEILQYREN